MKYFSVFFLLLFVQSSLGAENFNVEDCKKIFSSSDKVSYPQVILELDGTILNHSLVDEAVEISSYEGLKYRKREDAYARVTFAKTKSSSKDKSIVSLVKYWGVDLAQTPFSYWDSIVYFVEGLERYSSLRCDSLDEAGKLDVIVVSAMAVEILPFESQNAVVLAHNFEDAYYYLLSKYSDGRFSVELKINLDGNVYTVVASGNDRESLELFIAEVITLNKKSIGHALKK